MIGSGDPAQIADFLDRWSDGRLWLNTNTALDTRLNMVYNDDQAAFMGLRGPEAGIFYSNEVTGSISPAAVLAYAGTYTAWPGRFPHRLIMSAYTCSRACFRYKPQFRV